jgi:PKD repeat protein
MRTAPDDRAAAGLESSMPNLHVRSRKRLPWPPRFAVVALAWVAGPALAADIDADPVRGEAPLVVEFHGSSGLRGPRSWTWDFGDGKTGTGRNPTHTYDSPGRYTVRLEVTGDGDGTEGEGGGAGGGEGEPKTEVKVKHDLIRVVVPPVLARFEASPSSGCAPLSVKFRDRSTADANPTWRWKFGDGETSTERNPSHEYGAAGEYEVELEVTTDNGSSVAHGQITVQAPPRVDFTPSATTGCAPLEVTFTPRVETETGAATALRWDFGDGVQTLRESPVHVYGKPGTYTVVLAANDGCRATATKSIVVMTAPPPPPGRLEAPPTVLAGEEVPFRWPASAAAESYVVEGKLNGSTDWIAICEVEASGEDPASCGGAFPEEGVWSLRVSAVGDCGASRPAPGPDIDVLPAAFIAEWPLADCRAEGSSRELNGRVAGAVRCDDEDRFGRLRNSLRFTGLGLIRGASLPVLEGDFHVSLWVRPEGGEGDTAFLEIEPGDRGEEDAALLRLSWDEEERAVTVLADQSRATVNGLLPGWHHVLATRSGRKLALFIDGLAGPTVNSDAALGTEFAFGGTPAGNLFAGGLDDIVYASGPRSPDGVIDLVLAGGPTVFIDPSTVARNLAIEAGGAPREAMTLHLVSGVSGPLRLERLRLTIDEPRASAGSPAPAGLPDMQLFVGTQRQGVELRRDSGSDSLDLEDGESVDLPGDGDITLRVEAGLPAGRMEAGTRLRLSLATADDLGVTDASGSPVFVAGQRRSGAPAALGNLLRVVVAAPPKLSIAVEGTGQTIHGGPGAADLHRSRFTAGSSEGVRVAALTYRAAAGTSLDGVDGATLRVEGGAADAGQGTVDASAGTIAFRGLAIEIPRGSSEELIVEARLPEPLSTALGRAGMRPLVAALLASLVAVLLLDRARHRRLAWTPALVALVLLLGMGCGGDGGGGGPPSPPPPPPPATRTFQLELVRESVEAEGMTSGAPVELDAPGDLRGSVLETP